MSNMNEIPHFNWKGQTFNQITSKIQKNKNTYSGSPVRNYFHPLPLNIYRREIVTSDSSNCNPRTSLSVDIFDMPNGSIVNSSQNKNHNGLANTLDIHLTTNQYENFGCNDSNNCFNPAQAARRRVRSSGMIKKQFDVSKNNDQYCTSTSQYLVSRNRTFQQNQYNYIRQGDALVKPGDALSSQNVYSSNGINHCQKYQIVKDTSFQYHWLDSLYYTVDISAGFYNLEDINSKLKFAMSSNLHYYINKETKSHVFLINFAYNTFYNTVELQISKTNTSIFSSSNYTFPLDPTKGDGSLIDTWSSPTDVTVPVVIINNNIFQYAIGFDAGKYPNYTVYKNSSNLIYNRDSEENPVTYDSVDTLLFTSTIKPGVQPLYVPIFYKPNNPQFAQQGAVSSSSLITRKKYDTITNNSEVFRQAYGLAVANALAYGVPEGGYTTKDKTGMPIQKTPTFSKFDGSLKTCQTTKLFNG